MKVRTHALNWSALKSGRLKPRLQPGKSVYMVGCVGGVPYRLPLPPPLAKTGRTYSIGLESHDADFSPSWVPNLCKDRFVDRAKPVDVVVELLKPNFSSDDVLNSGLSVQFLQTDGGKLALVKSFE